MNVTFDFLSALFMIKKRAPHASPEAISLDDLENGLVQPEEENINLDVNVIPNQEEIQQAIVNQMNDIDPPMPKLCFSLREDARNTIFETTDPDEPPGKVYRSAKQNDADARSHFTLAQRINVFGHRLRNTYHSIDFRRLFIHCAYLLVVILCLTGLYYGFCFIFKPTDTQLPILHCFIPDKHEGKSGFKVQMNFSLQNVPDYPPFVSVNIRSPDKLINIGGKVPHARNGLYKGLVEGHADENVDKNITWFHLVRQIITEDVQNGFAFPKDVENQTVLLNCDFNVIILDKFEYLNRFGEIDDIGK